MIPRVDGGASGEKVTPKESRGKDSAGSTVPVSGPSYGPSVVSGSDEVPRRRDPVPNTCMGNRKMPGKWGSCDREREGEGRK